MSRVLLLVGFLVLATPIQAQKASSCTPTALFTEAYERDAKLLAIGRMYAVSSPDTALITIPQRDVDSILNDMAAICNLDTSVHADSIFRKYCIHQGHYPALRVKVDTNYVWTRTWRQSQDLTGNDPLGRFLSRYGYSIRAYTYYPTYPDSLNNIATLSSDSIVNFKAFADSLARFPGVLYTQFNRRVGDQDYITYERDTAVTIKFRMGWGDCTSECLFQEIWTYRVGVSCNVTLVSSDIHSIAHYPFREPSNCNLTPYEAPRVGYNIGLVVQLNPVSGELKIYCYGIGLFYDYVVTDIYGRTWLSGILGNKKKLSVADFTPGTYILRVRNNQGGQASQTFVKQ